MLLLPKTGHSYPAIMKLGTVIPYLKKVQKIYESLDTALEFWWNQHFFTGNQQILLYQEIQMEIAYWYIISSSFNLFSVFKDFLNVFLIFMMSAKMATLGLLKIKVFWNKGYGVIIHVHDVINQVLSRDSNCIGDVVMWPKFGNSSIYTREVIRTLML